MLCGELPEAVYVDRVRMERSLRELWTAADAQLNGGASSGVLPLADTLKALGRFLPAKTQPLQVSALRLVPPPAVAITSTSSGLSQVQTLLRRPPSLDAQEELQVALKASVGGDGDGAVPYSDLFSDDVELGQLLHAVRSQHLVVRVPPLLPPPSAVCSHEGLTRASPSHRKRSRVEMPAVRC